MVCSTCPTCASSTEISLHETACEHFAFSFTKSPYELMHDLYIAEFYMGLSFLLLIVSMTLSSFASIQRPTEKLYSVRWCSGRSRSFKIIKIGASRKPVCDSLLVFHCICMPIFYPLRDITICWSKICVFRCFTQRVQSRLKPLQGAFPCPIQR